MAKLYIIGTGCPVPNKKGFGSAFVLEIDNEYILIDCGPATTYKLIQMDLRPTEIDHLFITHHHFDHTADYPCFLLCRWDMSIGKENQLMVYGPPPTEFMTEQLIGENGAFSVDWRSRIDAPASQQTHQNRGGSLPRPKPSFSVKDIQPGKIVKNKNWSVIAVNTKHVQPYLESLAYRFDTPQGSIVFSGDTLLDESLINLAKGADVLVMSLAHPEPAGEIAGQAGVGKMILTHFGGNYFNSDNRENLCKNIKKKISDYYQGPLIFTDELTTVNLW